MKLWTGYKPLKASNALIKSKPNFERLPVKRFYVSVWDSFEAYQYNRPPACIVGVFAVSRNIAEEGLKLEPVSKDFMVFDTVEAGNKPLDEAITLEQYRNLRR